MSALLRSQEDSLRKLNEKICKFQQNGDTLGEFANAPRSIGGRGLRGEAGNFPSDPVLSHSAQEGEDFYANVTNPRGWVTMSSLSVEEEVQQLSMKIVQLER